MQGVVFHNSIVESVFTSMLNKVVTVIFNVFNPL